MSKRSSLCELFKGRHFLAAVIAVSVRWYREYMLSSRDISRLLAEWEISVDHSTTLRWVRRYAPEFEKKWHRYAHLIPVGANGNVAPTATIRGSKSELNGVGGITVQ